MRVHELAKELGVSSKELLATLEQMGVTGKSASSGVPEDLVPRLRASGGKATEAPKRREVLEPPPQPEDPDQPLMLAGPSRTFVCPGCDAFMNFGVSECAECGQLFRYQDGKAYLEDE